MTTQTTKTTRTRGAQSQTARTKAVPEVRLVPLGGLHEIGKNITALECGEDILEIMRGNIEKVIAGCDSTELHQAEQRLQEIDKARNDFISLIASGNVNEDSLDVEFKKLYEEEQQLKVRIEELKSKGSINTGPRDNIERAIETITEVPMKLTEFDDVIIRKLIECVKVISKTKIIIIFKGGFEMYAEVEK